MKNLVLSFFITFAFLGVEAQTYTEVKKLTAEVRSSGDLYGQAGSIHGNTVIVGAYYEDHDELEQDSIADAGSVYIYDRNVSGNWNFTQKLVASDRKPGMLYGYSVNMHGNHAIVSAGYDYTNAQNTDSMYRAGSAYILERDVTGTWQQVQKIVASDRAPEDYFANVVNIYGNYAIVGAPFEDEDASGLNPMEKAGSAYIYERDGAGNWNQVQKIVASDRAVDDQFGLTVAIHGNFAIVSAWSNDTDENGANPFVDAGAVYIFERNGSGTWVEIQKIVASDRGAMDEYGYCAEIYGNYIIVGAYGEDEDESGMNSMVNTGSAYIYERDGSGTWNEVQKIVASDRFHNDLFGAYVAITNGYAIVGAIMEDDDVAGNNAQPDAGSAYIYKRQANGSWTQTQKIVASDRSDGDWYGVIVGIDSAFAFVGAVFNEYDSLGAAVNSAGSAYIYELQTSTGIITQSTPVNINIFPNPSNGIVHFSGADLTDGSLRILDPVGRLVHSENNLSADCLFDFSGLGAGLYLIEFSIGQVTVTKKVMIF